MFPQKHFVILWIRERYILRNAYCSISLFLCGSIKSCQRRFNFGVFFFLFVCVCVGEGGGGGYSYIGEKGEKFKIPLQAGHYRPASETPFKWCFADDGPILNADRFSRI